MPAASMHATARDPVSLLRRLGDEYRHVAQEHHRQPATRKATRRKLAARLRELEERFERVLATWVPAEDDALRTRWHEFLRGRAPAPDEPDVAPPPLFRGTTKAGAHVDLRAAADGGYDLIVDGTHSEHSRIPWHLEPDRIGPVQINHHICEEGFEAPVAAIDALADFLAGHSEWPAPWARELLEDGLVDPERGLSARGRRALARRQRELAGTTTAAAEATRACCVLVADRVRARVLVLDGDGAAEGELVERGEITNPALRTRDIDLVTNSGQGRRGGHRAPLGATVDHRGERRRGLARHFAAQVAEEAASVWRRYPACDVIVAADPIMLGLLRPAIAAQLRAQDRVDVHELPGDLSKLAPPALHDQLAAAGLIPARGRRPPMIPAPGQPSP
jgi:protein required for attachment to host cells